MRAFPVVIALLGTAFIVGCNEGTAPELKDTQQPLLDYSNGPEYPGKSHVWRWENPFLIVLGGTDPVRNLISAVGMGAVDPAESRLCGGDAPVDVFSFQEHLDWDALVWSKTQYRGTGVAQQVWDGDPFYRYIAEYLDEHPGQVQEAWDAAMCNVTPLAQGRGNYWFIANAPCKSVPWYSVCEGWIDRGAHSYGWTAQGKLVDPTTGQRFRYSENQRALISPDGTFKGFLVENIFLRPIGRR